MEASQRSQPSFIRKVPTFPWDAINAKHLSSFRSQLVGFGGRLRVRVTRSTPSVRKQPRESSADARRLLKAGRIVRMEGWMEVFLVHLFWRDESEAAEAAPLPLAL